jgi:hypothetical protein
MESRPALEHFTVSRQYGRLVRLDDRIGKDLKRPWIPVFSRSVVGFCRRQTAGVGIVSVPVCFAFRDFADAFFIVIPDTQR